jgi:protein SCO1
MKLLEASILAAACASLSLAAVPVLGAEDHSHHHHPAQAAAPAQTDLQIRLSDAPLVDQDGKPAKLKSQVVGDKIVVMDVIYTSCMTVCPVVSAILAKLQDRLGERLGAEVELVSISVDPVRDTPARLKAYAAKHGAKPGWIWLTGQPQNVAEVLKSIGAYTANFEEHPAMILVGDGKTGQWTRLYGFTDPETVMARVDELTAARAAATAQNP